MNRRIIIQSLAEAEAAIAAAAALGLPVTLMSAPGAGAYAGVAWWQALVAQAAAAHPETNVTAMLDCAEEAGTVLAGLRIGLRHLRFTGPAETQARLAAIAAQSGAQIEGEEPFAALDIRGRYDAETACRAFLAAAGTGA